MQVVLSEYLPDDYLPQKVLFYPSIFSEQGCPLFPESTHRKSADDYLVHRSILTFYQINWICLLEVCCFFVLLP